MYVYIYLCICIYILENCKVITLVTVCMFSCPSLSLSHTLLLSLSHALSRSLSLSLFLSLSLSLFLFLSLLLARFVLSSLCDEHVLLTEHHLDSECIGTI